MSYTAHIKRELARIVPGTCCQKTEFLALLRMTAVAHPQEGQIVFRTEYAAIARKIFSLIKKMAKTTATVHVQRKQKLKKNHVFQVSMPLSTEVDWQQEMRYDPIHIQKVCCQRAYLRAAFLAGGSMNAPERLSYHLEITCQDPHLCDQLCTLSQNFFIGARSLQRKKNYVFYVKESEKICTMLNVIGAHQAMLQFEEIRIVREMRNAVNRAVNCETANVNKTVSASMRQIEHIAFLIEELGIEQLPLKLREVALIRLNHPDLNLQEIGDMMKEPISKSGVNHRLRKLEAWAQSLRLIKDGL